LGVPLLANRLIQDLDQQLDSAPAQFYDARVSGHQYKKLRHGTTYYLSAVRQLDSGNVRFEVDPATYNAVPDGAILRIEEKPGWLHIPWVRSYQPAAAVRVER